MRDVVARCEEGFAAQILAHELQMDKMTLHVKAMQADMKIMKEVLSERDAQISKLKLENNCLKAKPETVETSTQTTPACTSSATQTPPMSDLAPAIVQVVQHISEAISTGHTPKEADHDDTPSCSGSQVDIPQAASCVFQNVVASGILNKPRDVDAPKHAITQTTQSSLAVTPDFIPIGEAVLFLPFASTCSTMHAICIIEEEAPVPELFAEYVYVKEEDVIEPFFEEDDTASCVEEVSIESLVEDDIVESLTVGDNIEEETIKCNLASEKEVVYGPNEEDIDDDSDDHGSFWENKNLVCNSSDDSDMESGDMETGDMVTGAMVTGSTAMNTEQTKEDGYIAYSRSINQILPFSILFNRWMILCVSLYIIFYQTI